MQPTTSFDSKLDVDNLADIKLSKKLAYYLRHGALESGLKLKPDGFIEVQELKRKLKDCTFGDIERVVKNDSKNRYTLRTNNGVLEIKANQGHSIAAVSELSLRPIHEANFDIIHGTYFDKWKVIRVQGLSRMKRNHIHFAKGMDATSGFRRTAQILIYIDFAKAVHDGIQFYESDNGVILSSGDSFGRIDAKYFKKVVSSSGEIVQSS